MFKFLLAIAAVYGAIFVWRSTMDAGRVDAPPPARPTQVLAASFVTVVIDPDKDDGRSIDIRASSGLQVDLPSQPSTGYRWEALAPLPHFLTFQTSSYVDDGPAGPGARKRQRLNFEVLAPGQGDLTLVYRQPWSQGDTARRIRLKIVSRP